MVSQRAIYDLLGRRVRSLEENSSVLLVAGSQVGIYKGWNYAYNDNGDLVGTSDARGCGENLSYDKLGRLVAEDYSPCTREQEPYSPPNFTTGEGVERLNLYDTPTVPGGFSSDSIYRGRLTATFDRAQKSDVVLDARGRPSLVRRQLAIPKAGSRPFATRYAPRVYQRGVLEYDEANRALLVTTGAANPELRPAHVGSWIKTLYTPRGTVDRVTSSYGTLVTSQQFDAFGALTKRVFADAANTTLRATYNDGRLLRTLKISRRPGPWLRKSPTYLPPPNFSEANTLQGVLTSLVFDYDDAQNPVQIVDASAGAEWPDGAMPAMSKALTYDDAYRLRRVDTQYVPRIRFGPTDDTFVSPLAAEEKRGDTTFPHVSGAPNRIRQESFAYDWMGNTTLADDDAHLFDRSPGTITNGGEHQHQSASATQGGTVAVPTYDAAGDVVRIEIRHNVPCAIPCPARYEYVWNEVGQLSAASRADATGSQIGPVVAVNYAYDGDGARVLKSVKSWATGVVTHTADVFETLQLNGAAFPDADGDYEQTARTERVYLASGAGVLGRVEHVEPDTPSGTGGRTRVFLTLGDQLGSTSFVIDKETGELVERATYEAFGASESDYRPDRWKNFRDDYRYTKHADDSQVGLAYFGARYYAPSLGRWVSPDPVTVHAMAGDMNAYAFALGSPMRFVDPDGMDPGCDNLNPNCGSYGIDLPGLLEGIANAFGGSSGGGGGTGGDGRRANPVPMPEPPDRGVFVTASPIYTPLWQAISNPALMQSPVDVGPVARAFNAGVDKHAEVLAGIGGLAIAQGAVLGTAATSAGVSSLSLRLEEFSLRLAVTSPRLSATALEIGSVFAESPTGVGTTLGGLACGDNACTRSGP